MGDGVVVESQGGECYWRLPACNMCMDSGGGYYRGCGPSGCWLTLAQTSICIERTEKFSNTCCHWTACFPCVPASKVAKAQREPRAQKRSGSSGGAPSSASMSTTGPDDEDEV